MNPKLVFIGAGNLATQLSLAFRHKGIQIAQIYSRTSSSANRLGELLQTSFTDKISEINNNADLYFIAVKDSAIEQVLAEIQINNKFIIHCSGSVPLSVLKRYSENTGVFYPLQTFSKERRVNFDDIPVFVEANSSNNENILINLARILSSSVSVLDSQKRKRIHIAAVFACNFVNHCYSLAYDLLKSVEVPFNAIKPLILETAHKVQQMEPKEAQTGPAVRFDENIISEHLSELKNMDSYSELYNSISKSIFEHHKKKY